jgi:glycosyltransferase involved in cell wall biosynthesis
VLSRRYSARFVYEIRDLWPATLVEAGTLARFHPVALLFGVIERLCLRAAETVVTVLPAANDYLAAHGASPQRLRWIPNGVDLGLVPDQSSLPTTRPFRFMYAGALGWANGLDLLLEAVAILEGQVEAGSFELVLMGAGAEADRLRRLSGERGLATVRFDAAVPKADVYAKLASAHALIMILRDSPVFRWGVSPNKLFDYFAVGRPVLFAVNAGNNPVAEARCGVSADPRSPPAIAEAMRTLLSCGPDALADMGRQARSYVEAHHDLRRIGARLADVLSDATSS